MEKSGSSHVFVLLNYRRVGVILAPEMRKPFGENAEGLLSEKSRRERI